MDTFSCEFSIRIYVFVYVRDFRPQWRPWLTRAYIEIQFTETIIKKIEIYQQTLAHFTTTATMLYRKHGFAEKTV